MAEDDFEAGGFEVALNTPGMTGTDLARAVRARRPDLPVLIISGYAEMDGIAPGFMRLDLDRQGRARLSVTKTDKTGSSESMSIWLTEP